MTFAVLRNFEGNKANWDDTLAIMYLLCILSEHMGDLDSMPQENLEALKCSFIFKRNRTRSKVLKVAISWDINDTSQLSIDVESWWMKKVNGQRKLIDEERWMMKKWIN